MIKIIIKRILFQYWYIICLIIYVQIYMIIKHEIKIKYIKIIIPTLNL
jgi:hypothetical protein